MRIYEAHQLEDERIPFLLYSFTYEKGESLGFSNWHENVELLYVTRGSAVVNINAERFELGEGEVAVVNSNYIHDVFAPEDMHFYCLIVDRSFCLSNHFDTNCIRFLPFVKDAELCRMIDSFAREYGDEKPYRVQTLRALGLSIMSLICSQYSTEQGKTEDDTQLMTAIKRVLGYIHAESKKPMSLDELSELAGFSKFYFAREFRRVTGYTVVEYINQVRCKNAKRLLLENKMNISSVAKECGFQNASYFSRTFFSIEGMLPVEYKASAIKGKD